MKTFKFSLVLRTRENTDVFITLDDNIYGIHSKRVNILCLLLGLQREYKAPIKMAKVCRVGGEYFEKEYKEFLKNIYHFLRKSKKSRYFPTTLVRKVTSFIMILLTLKAPRKPASENVICLCRLLNILANFSNLFLHTGKQYGPILFNQKVLIFLIPQ